MPTNDQTDFDQAFAEMMAEEEAVEAPAKKSKRAAKPKAERAPRTPREKKVDGPNKFGIIQKKSGQVITTSYLMRYVYCASRERTFNRKANLAFLCSDEFLQTMAGKDTGELSRAVAYHACWNDPAHPENDVVAPAARVKKEPKPKAEKKAKGKKPADTAVAEDIEAAVLGEAPLY